jgi:hypothetical protein
MQHLVFSTIERYGLEDEPRVTVAFDKSMEVSVAFSVHNIWFKEPTERASLLAGRGFEIFAGFLKKLWLETKQGQSVPVGVMNA